MKRAKDDLITAVSKSLPLVILPILPIGKKAYCSPDALLFSLYNFCYYCSTKTYLAITILNSHNTIEFAYITL